MRELPAGGAGLRQQLGDRRLQQFLRKQERGFERHARGAAGALLDGAASIVSGLSSRNQRGSRWNSDASSPSTSSEGTRLPLSIMLR